MACGGEGLDAGAGGLGLGLETGAGGLGLGDWGLGTGGLGGCRSWPSTIKRLVYTCLETMAPET